MSHWEKTFEVESKIKSCLVRIGLNKDTFNLLHWWSKQCPFGICSRIGKYTRRIQWTTWQGKFLFGHCSIPVKEAWEWMKNLISNLNITRLVQYLMLWPSETKIPLSNFFFLFNMSLSIANWPKVKWATKKEHALSFFTSHCSFPTNWPIVIWL